MPARSIDTATIAFGLVSIPVKIYSTNEPSHQIHFHMIHAGCGERLHQQYVCPIHGHVERDDIARGFELTKNNFVELSKEELEALEAVASDELAIREFVPASAVDPIYVDATYYLGPGKGGERAYGLLHDALVDSELVGIASYAARGKQYVVMVRPFEDGLAMHQLRYPDEIKPWSEVPLGRHARPAAAELQLAKQIVSQLRHDAFDASTYKDEVKGRVRELIAEKAKGGAIVAPPEAPHAAPTDLMAALKASLAQAGAAQPDGHHGRTGAPRRKGAAAHRGGRTTAHRGARAARRGARATAHRGERAARASGARRGHGRRPADATRR